MNPRTVIPNPNLLSNTPPFMPFMSRCWVKASWVMSECCRFLGFFHISGTVQTLGPEISRKWPPPRVECPWWLPFGACAWPVLAGPAAPEMSGVSRIPAPLLLLTGMMRTASVFLSWSLLTQPIKHCWFCRSLRMTTGISRAGPHVRVQRGQGLDAHSPVSLVGGGFFGGSGWFKWVRIYQLFEQEGYFLCWLS